MFFLETILLKKPSVPMKKYLTFTRTDRIGLLALVALILIIIFLPSLFPKSGNRAHIIIDSSNSSAIAATQSGNPASPFSLEEIPEPTKKSSHSELFQFDPNTLNAQGWERLGLEPKIARTLLNYRNKGGHFYKKEDLKKIWGLPPSFYERVADYIVLDNKPKKHDSYPLKKETRISAIEINSADTTAFIALPGIGSVLANRIIKFREKMGGFYSVDQIAETWGLRDSTFKLIKPRLTVKEELVRKFNINKTSKEELKVHPYFRWQLANAIVDYRQKHGAFTSLEDLKNIPGLDAATIERIKHYLTL